MDVQQLKLFDKVDSNMQGLKIAYSATRLSGQLDFSNLMN